MKLLKHWRIWLLLMLLIMSVYFISPFGSDSVVVRTISTDSPFYGKIEVGDEIRTLNDKEIKEVDDFYSFSNFTGSLRYTTPSDFGIADIKSPGLGVVVAKESGNNINLGLDLIGGTRVLLQPKENVSTEVMEHVLSTLQTRINIYGLRESKFQMVTDVSGKNFIQIEMAGGTRSEVEELLARQGKFEAKIFKQVKFANNSGTLMGTPLELYGNSVRVDGSVIGINETFEIKEIEIELLNITDNTAFFFAKSFTSDDIKSVCIQEQGGLCVSRITRAADGWQFQFQVFITPAGAQKFAEITKDSLVLPSTSEQNAVLEDRLFLFLDGNLITDLNIGAGLKGQAYTEPLITGGGATQEETESEKLRLQSILESGALPIGVEVIKADQISATLGRGFVGSAFFAGIIAILAVGVVGFIRYRNIKIVLSMLFTSFSEAILILGMASLINWTIDLAAIAGIIATLGTGIDSQIAIIDEMKFKTSKSLTIKQRIKNALFIIFGSAATVIVSMIPLMIIGVGVMRGFAITTILGVLISVLIARPAFSYAMEMLFSADEKM